MQTLERREADQNAKAHKVIDGYVEPSQDLELYKETERFKELERYRNIAGDLDTFTATLQTALPVCIATNTLRVDADDLYTRLKEKIPSIERLPWNKYAFRLHAEERPSRLTEHMIGLFTIQEEVSLLPVHVLDPKPGERILDLCAAPGMKTAQIAIHMQGRGSLLANDIHCMRMRPLQKIIRRLGLANVITSNEDGATFPKEVGKFDKILADVPCGCEGTTRKHSSLFEKYAYEKNFSLFGLQRALLQKAFQLCEVGGTIVYSTCTYAPEENEIIVDTILKENQGAVKIEPIEVENFSFSSGLTNWEGRELDPSLKNTMRVWPQQNNTGGFYVAKLKRLE